MKIFMAGLVLMLSQAAFSQVENFIATGKVLDASNKQLLSGASVFCQNTTLGTITNKEGTFSIRLPKGGYDLIVSYTGYETENLHINSSNATDLVIELKTKDMNMSEVTVSGSNEVADGLAKYGKFFTDNFIGTTPNAGRCLIENPEVLQFYFSKKRNRLKVKAKEDLVIVNNALGYKIKYQLDSFSHEYATGVSTYSGYPFFEELPGPDSMKTTWSVNRLSAYNGSRLHFVRSWYDSTLADEGFALEAVDKTKKILTTVPIPNPYDSAHYIVSDNEDVVINWPGRFRVVYKNEMPDKRFLTQYKLPSYLKSQLTILDIEDEFVIEQNGYFYEQRDMINTGYWSWEKVAEALPYDYNPE
ncbi:MAG TPA: carboxypeptidase-like regulatory domain-containing protein [Chitinophagaceae bacterium]|nr:carboxypeptidase-like regulatory domain-containing protein [Chitinophagaceae bacterium]